MICAGRFTTRAWPSAAVSSSLSHSSPLCSACESLCGGCSRSLRRALTSNGPNSILIRENAIRDKKYGYVDRKKQEAYQEMAVRARLPTPAATEKETFEGKDVEVAGRDLTEEEKTAAATNGTLGSPATRTRTGREKTEQEKKEDRERYWRYLL